MSNNRLDVNLKGREPSYTDVSKGHGKKGQVKKGSWLGKNISINNQFFNKGSLIEFINNRLSSADANAPPRLKKGWFGIGASKNSDVRKAYTYILNNKMPHESPEVQSALDNMASLATSDLTKINGIGNEVIAADLHQINAGGVAMLQIPDKTIISGHGEYIVFEKKEGDKPTSISEEHYGQVFEIFRKYTPTELINEGQTDKLTDRHAHILEEVKKMNPNYEIAFVPRTLYELTFVRKTIQEDIKHWESCPAEDALDTEVENHRHKCWHLGNFTNPDEEGEHKNVREMAFRLNKVLVKALQPSNAGLTYEQLLGATEREISFFQKYYGNASEIRLQADTHGFKAADVKIKTSQSDGPSKTFEFFKTAAGANSRPIKTKEDAQILRNAVALECSTLAQTSFLLFRGAQHKSDTLERTDETFKDLPQAMSYGTSLFAGILRDRGASAFWYAQEAENDAYVLHIPFLELADSPFYIPKALHSVWQLSARGEFFHPRAKVWNIDPAARLGGVSGIVRVDELRKAIIQPDVTKEEAINAFAPYHARVIHLKPKVQEG